MVHMEVVKTSGIIHRDFFGGHGRRGDGLGGY